MKHHRSVGGLTSLLQRNFQHELKPFVPPDDQVLALHFIPRNERVPQVQTHQN